VVSVISGVRSLAAVLGADADLLEAAAWLHDIGYTADLANTGLHALDGARYLRAAQHADAMLCRLVAYQSCAIIEAGECGLTNVLPGVRADAAGAVQRAAGRRARAGRKAARRDTSPLRPRAPR
jgi:HD superfamily phosphodiesterase